MTPRFLKGMISMDVSHFILNYQLRFHRLSPFFPMDAIPGPDGVPNRFKGSGPWNVFLAIKQNKMGQDLDEHWKFREWV